MKSILLASLFCLSSAAMACGGDKDKKAKKENKESTKIVADASVEKPKVSYPSAKNQK